MIDVSGEQMNRSSSVTLAFHPKGRRRHSSSLLFLGPYLPGGYPFSPYGAKIAAGDEGGDKSRASPTVTKSATDSKALEILHQHASQYKSKSPTVGDKPPHDRDREQDRATSDRDRDRERDRERDVDRPRSSPSQRILPSHTHLGYSVLSGQYDLSYPTGQSTLTLCPLCPATYVGLTSCRKSWK